MLSNKMMLSHTSQSALRAPPCVAGAQQQRRLTHRRSNVVARSMNDAPDYATNLNKEQYMVVVSE
jgi:hypothetical protein